MKRLVAIILCTLLLFSLVACKSSGQAASGIYPEGFEKYYAVLGQKWDAALNELGVTEENLTVLQENSRYQLSETVEFCGHIFTVSLYKDRSLNRVSGVSYQIEKTDHSPETMAKDVHNFVQSVYNGFAEDKINPIRPAASDKVFLHEYEESDYLSYIAKSANSENVYQFDEYWIVKEADSKLAKEYLAEGIAYVAENTNYTLVNKVEFVAKLRVAFAKGDYYGIKLDYVLDTYREGVTYWEE